MEQSEEVKRAVRTAMRSIEAAQVEPPTEEPCQHMAAASQQLAFAVDKLADSMLNSPHECPPQN
jgi:hypothetical protein